MRGEEVGKLISPGSAAELDEMLRWWRAQTRRGPRTPEPEPPQAPEVYICKTPAGGIAAKVDEPGSGTDSSIADVSYANCNLYRIDHKTDTDIEIEPLGVSMPVYNIGSSAIAGSTIIMAVRDKPGHYVAMNPAGASSSVGGSGTLTLVSTAVGTATDNSGMTNPNSFPAQTLFSGLEAGTYLLFGTILVFVTPNYAVPITSVNSDYNVTSDGGGTNFGNVWTTINAISSAATISVGGANTMTASAMFVTAAAGNLNLNGTDSVNAGLSGSITSVTVQWNLHLWKLNP